MASKILWATVGAALVLVFAAAVFVFNSGPGEPTVAPGEYINLPPTSTVASAPSSEGQPQVSATYPPQVKPTIKEPPESLDKIGCSDNVSSAEKVDCIITAVSASNDSSPCLLAGDDFTVGECFFRAARETEDPQPCFMISAAAQKDSCVYYMAVRVRNASLCSSISSESSRMRCLSSLTKDVTACDSIGDVKSRDWCLYAFSSRNSDLEICKKINATDVRDRCIMDFIDLHRLDPRVCTLIEDYGLRLKCQNLAVPLICPLSSFKPKYGVPL
ncbi:Uncharacterised protein [uncultured archaeon]|nr:Uncharacterised protein [uncultured archaeon]